MGRHSIPDPDESAGEEQAQEPQTEQSGYVGDDEHDYGPGSGEPEYGAPGYGLTEYPDLGDRESEYTKAEPPEHEHRQSAYPEPSSRETEYDTSDDEPEPVRLPRRRLSRVRGSPGGIGSATANSTPLRATARR